jgi:hypothetical protein
MNRLMFAMALAVTTCGASGCCCCRGLFPQTVAAVAPAPAPVACPPAYDPCAAPPVTYGTAPVGTYGPAPAYAAPVPAVTAPAPTW